MSPESIFGRFWQGKYAFGIPPELIDNNKINFVFKDLPFEGAKSLEKEYIR